MNGPSAILAWAGTACGAVALGWCVYETGRRVGVAQGKRRADEGHFDQGWDQGYDRGWAACRDKAIEFGVGAICD